MIKTEVITINGKKYKRTYSDANFIIERDGEKYGEAIDPIDVDRVYIETDELIEDEEDIEEEIVETEVE